MQMKYCSCSFFPGSMFNHHLPLVNSSSSGRFTETPCGLILLPTIISLRLKKKKKKGRISARREYLATRGRTYPLGQGLWYPEGSKPQQAGQWGLYPLLLCLWSIQKEKWKTEINLVYQVVKMWMNWTIHCVIVYLSSTIPCGEVPVRFHFHSVLNSIHEYLLRTYRVPGLGAWDGNGQRAQLPWGWWSSGEIWK